MKKKLLTLGLSGTLSALPVSLLAVSCGSTSDEAIVIKDASKVKLVTDAGDINDKSFNQQAAEALQEILGKASLSPSDYQKPASHDAASIVNSYQALSQNDTEVVLAPGFYHVDAIGKWNADHDLNDLKFIVADSASVAANVAGITYQTQASGFIAGYLSALYLKQINDTTPKVGTFGGGNFSGVTDFMTGFVFGIKYFNDNLTNQDIAFGGSKVTFAKLGADNDYTNSGFVNGGGTSKTSALITDGADIILPVAGPQTADTISAIRAANKANDVKIIGVDTDQALAYTGDASLFLTSIIKDVKNSLINVYNKIAGKPLTVSDAEAAKVQGLGGTTIGTLTNGWTGVARNAATDLVLGTEKLYDIANKVAVIQVASGINQTWSSALAYIKAN